ncbi:uncharacterized protein LOC131933236 [Physella acuta]|uniref:uncharacterized protein LOC131933236 n=1 Tax=Physella acuta TaxID=109671 RepID=UPI0027DC730D|nr:uncharacterized protein LOC131933236 [Physella acuta]XP_059146002.1 uncharacterized protein LOC131933236 [Physella acuta]XP_059146003.1 uncharacterized protein LOC131933236 [Physella acuta]XP_059146004.1 uncharacterized protein LOC131933236 [Physella acuta]
MDFDGTLWHHEAEVDCLDEADTLGRFSACSQPSGHGQLVPVTSFTQDNLPADMIDLLDAILALAGITVKLTVKRTSPHRPEFFPDSRRPYPHHNRRGQRVILYGSGRVDSVSIHQREPCPCTGCVQSGEPRVCWGEILVNTAAHCVFDTVEAQRTTCTFDFDSADSPAFDVAGLEARGVDVDGDRCLLRCVSHDVDKLAPLEARVQLFDRLASDVCERYKGCKDENRLAVIVSHPHGRYKRISVGQWVNRLPKGINDAMFEYTTATCPGSSGAFVFMPGREGYWSDHVHSCYSSQLQLKRCSAGYDV